MPTNNLVWFESIAWADGMATTPGPPAKLGPAPTPPGGKDSVVLALGYWFPGDGGGGLFHWDPFSGAQPDSGTVFEVPGHPIGRWIRLDSGPLNVRWFGAKGDGFDDSGAIQKALTAAAGKTLYVPAGHYHLKLNLPLLPLAGTRILGDGFKGNSVFVADADSLLVKIGNPLVIIESIDFACLQQVS
jgi:hypothetical protein